MKSKFPTLDGLTPNDNGPHGEPRGHFQVFAQRRNGGNGEFGAGLYRGSFDSEKWAMTYALALIGQYEDTDKAYYLGYEWVQVADMRHGAIWCYVDGQWVQIEGVDE